MRTIWNDDEMLLRFCVSKGLDLSIGKVIVGGKR